MESKGSSSCVVTLIVFMLIVFPGQAFGGVPEPMEAGAEPPAEPEGVSGVFFAQTGSYVEHTPSIIQCSNGTFFLAYESATSISSKFTVNMTWSADGVTWAPDWVAITSAGTMGNRHPTLIQRNDGLLMMAYFSDRSGAYRVYTATSTNGRSWTESGALALQNPAVNPFIIKRAAGGYAMSYQRYGSASDGSYFASSSDGVSWTAPTTRVTAYSLPRLMEYSSGNYLMTYQGGTTGSTFDIRYRTSSGGTTWSAETRLTYTGNSHDSFPLVLANNTYMVFFCTAVGNQYDLYRKWSYDLSAWSNNELLTTGNTRYDTEPHPCQLQSNQTFLLSWGYESNGAVGGYENVDIALMWIEDIPPTFNIIMNSGWNLISIPWIQTDTSPAAVLASIEGEYEVAMAYDPSDPQDHWKSYRPGGINNDLTAIDHKMGIWIKATSMCVLTVTGIKPTTTNINIITGWSLVGYPSETPRQASTTLPPQVDMIGIWDPSPPYIQDIMNLNTVTMMPGHGYWVHSMADCVWSVSY